MYNHKESVEDYLEKILMLRNQNEHVRAIDVAKYMNYSKASVSIALKKLKEKNLVNIDDKGYITLTHEGEQIASSTLERHNLLKSVLMHIGVDEKIAEDDACKIEHLLSNTSFNALKKILNK